MNIQKLSVEKLAALLRLIESDDMIELLFPILESRQKALMATLISHDGLDRPSSESREILIGRLREIGWFASLHDVVIDELKKKKITQS